MKKILNGLQESVFLIVYTKKMHLFSTPTLLKNFLLKNARFLNRSKATSAHLSTPFFDTRDTDRLRMVANIILYPYEYCLRPENRNRVLEISPSNLALNKLLEILRKVQSNLAATGITNSRSIWNEREKYAKLIRIKTSIHMSHSKIKILTEQSNDLLNIRLLEGVVERTAISNDVVSDDEIISNAAECIWLSDHLALFVLGIASLEIDSKGTVTIAPRNESMKKHLRRVWFGNALEEMSLRAASTTLEIFSRAIREKFLSQADLTKLHIQALCIFPQHWRLPVEDGPVSKLMWEYLAPLLKILTNVLIENGRSSQPRPFTLKDAKKLKADYVFKLVYDMQKKLPLVDRLFDVVDEGLILGTRSLAPGSIAIAEHIATTVLGKDWHGYVSEIQKNNVFRRLSSSPNIKILNEELRQHDSENDLPLDVDFFVRDEIHAKIYAVQLKHFEQSDKGGLLAWVARLRERERNLGKAVKQLENLRELITYDKKIQTKLNAIGISSDEFSSIIPVVLHTVGILDFWELQSGVLLHDIHTFCNVLNGFSSTSIGIINDEFFSKSNEKKNTRLGLHQTDLVIDLYSNDPLFKRELGHFDLANRMTRTLNFNGQLITAAGLGI